MGMRCGLASLCDFFGEPLGTPGGDAKARNRAMGSRQSAVVARARNHLYLRPPYSLHAMLLQTETSLHGEVFRTAA